MKKSVQKYVRLFSYFCAALACVMSASQAMAEVSATANFRSNYVWHGQPLGENGTIDGSLDYSHESGLTAGLWASSYSSGAEDTNEIDYYAGYNYDVSEDLSFGALYTFFSYTNPGTDSDSDEITLSGTYKIATLSFAYYREFNGIEDDGRAYYIKLALNHDIDDKSLVTATIAQTIIDEKAAIGMDSYLDYLLGYYRKVEGFKVGFEFTDTNREDDTGTKFEDSRGTFIVSKTF